MDMTHTQLFDLTKILPAGATYGENKEQKIKVKNIKPVIDSYNRFGRGYYLTIHC